MIILFKIDICQLINCQKCLFLLSEECLVLQYSYVTCLGKTILVKINQNICLLTTDEGIPHIIKCNCSLTVLGKYVYDTEARNSCCPQIEMEIQALLYSDSWAPSHSKWVAKKVHFSISVSSKTKKYQNHIQKKLNIDLCPAVFS